MNRADVLKAWRRILAGYRPLLSIEVTRECPLHCPGCYAYELNHLGGPVTLRQLADQRGESLVQGILALIERHRPLHVSLVGGDPLVRYREMQEVIPKIIDRGIYVQLVTSAFREIPRDWARMHNLKVVVSIDGLAPEHDERRKPATYQRILKNIQGGSITVHCTITSQMMSRPSYLEEFVWFWSSRPEVAAIWFSIFTPQKGATDPEILTSAQRQHALDELLRLRAIYPKLDMLPETIMQFAHPPESPSECIFARTETNISADLKTKIMPCQFGGNPDCAQCGCLASMALAAVGRKKLGGSVQVGEILKISDLVGRAVAKARAAAA